MSLDVVLLTSRWSLGEFLLDLRVQMIFVVPAWVLCNEQSNHLGTCSQWLDVNGKYIPNSLKLHSKYVVYGLQLPKAGSALLMEFLNE